MPRLVEFPLDDGGAVTVAVTGAGPGRPSRETTRGMRREADVVERSRVSFDTAVAMVRPAADALLTKLQELDRVPNEIQVEFGIELAAEAGAFIATASTAAQFRVSMTWRRDGVAPSSNGDEASAS